MKRVDWILNLDADLEFAAPGGYEPSTNLASQVKTSGKLFLAAAECSKIRHVRAGDPAGAGDTRAVVQAFCPTPRAHAAARDAAVALPAAPPMDVLQRVNHRGFAASLRDPTEDLPRCAFVRDLDELDRHLAVHADSGTEWLLKRPFGFSGRGRKRLGPSPGAQLVGAERRWAAASMTEYGLGLQVEPFVDIVREFAVHGFLTRDGRCLRGSPTRLRTDPGGGFTASALAADDVTDLEAALLEANFDRVQRALTATGYFGPFGIDGFRWRDRGGTTRFRPLSEINARYTMGFFVGIGERQDEWLDLAVSG